MESIHSPLVFHTSSQVKMQTEIEADKKHETEHDDLERAPTGKGEMEEERIELSEEDVSLTSRNDDERWQR